jgi:hypothetical protein
MLFVFMRGHPQLSEAFNGLPVIVAILLNHMVFGVVVALVY